MSLYRDQIRVYVFLGVVLLAVRMVADVTETRYVIPIFFCIILFFYISIQTNCSILFLISEC